MFKGYEISEILHQGIKSNVYRATFSDGNLPVVIKSLANPYPTPLEIARLRHEFQQLQGLEFQGVPKVFGFEKNDNTYCIVLIDHQGVPVKSYVDNALLDVAGMLSIAEQLCQILAFIHSQQIIHRDIKPQNIIVSPSNGEVQIIDFELATRLMPGIQEATGVLEGSLPYISPEQTGRMNRPVDYRSDLYSLGVTLFELTTGQLPFTANHPLEWIHAHLAQAAPDPRTFRPDLPEAIARIILKLLSKSADDRYQSAYNLQKDLKNCVAQWHQNKFIVPFEPNIADSFGLFILPSKLYGREEQLEQLSQIMNRVIEIQKPQLILVSGYSGIGKTVLIQEARKQITIAKGNFTKGKFDQLNRNIPYFGFTIAFTDLAKQLLAEKEEDLQVLKSQLLTALGANIQIINQLIPAFELIIGTHATPPQLLPEEASNRFLQTLKSFVKTLASPNRPLIIFIDDLQWADVASLTLIELLAADTELQSLGIIGSYRSNEVNDAHPLKQTLNKVKAVLPIHEIHLANLEESDILELLLDAFKRPVKDTMGMAKLLYTKTQGNPFFLTQSLLNLKVEGQIKFDTAKGHWDWKQEELDKMNITDNVVELMVSKIQKLSPQGQQSLKLAACIGNEFSLHLLSCIANNDELIALKQPLEMGLISALDENYVLLSDAQQFHDNLLNQYFSNHETLNDAKFRFLHDRVQQAAYSLMTEEERKEIHLKLGQNLSRNSDAEGITEQIFTICNHLNKGKEYITTSAERLKLAALNLQAGNKAREATAFVQALEYISTGIELLDPSAIETNYNLWKGLHHEVAQCFYLTGDIQNAKAEYEQLLLHSQSKLDKLVVYRSLVDMYSSRGMHKEVTETVAAALQLFNINIPTRPFESKLRIMSSIAEIKWKLRNKSMDDLIHGRRCTDLDHIKLAELLLEAGPSIFLSNQDLFAWLVLFEVRFALKLGHTPSSPLGFTGYGMIMNRAFGDVEIAFKMAAMGERLNESLGSVFPYHKLKFVQLNFIKHYRNDVNTYLEDFYKLGKMALADGDYLYLGLNYYDIICYRSAMGQPIEEILQESGSHLKHLAKLNNQNGYDLLLCRYQSLLALSGKPILPWEAGMPDATIDSKLNRFKKELAFTNLTELYIYIYQTNYLLNLNEQNLTSHLLDSIEYLSYLDGSYSYVDLALFHALVILKTYPSQSKAIQQKFRKIVLNHLKTLKNRSLQGSVNYLGYCHLVQAVNYLIIGRPNRALQLLESIVSDLEKRNLHHLSAIAKELIGKIYLERKQNKIALVYIEESAYDYLQWGASAKVKLMIDEYPSLILRKGNELNFLMSQNNSETSHFFDSKYGLDLTSLMKSAATISGEILLNKLLPSMISIVVENAGAEVGYLILKNENDLVLAVKRSVLSAEAEFMHNLPLNECNEVAQSVVQYSHRSHDTLLLDHAYHDERFKNDAHISANKLKSILCIPILHQGNFRGAIYLENNLITYAFSAERVSVMNILSAQIAVALDNALLYRNLEESLNNQVTLTEAYSRFTPNEYLRFLGHTSILDVKLGDYRSEKMTVLFCDIRAYTSIAELFTAEENFKFLSAYLEKMTEIITSHNGMVNQLLGDGILAFFNVTKDALEASIEMQVFLQNYQVENLHGAPINIKAGIGMHSGEVIIGIMGNAKRMDTGIVSDTVNAASRIEGLTKHFGVNILLSETLIEQLDCKPAEQFRFIGRVQVKGKNQHIGLYECFDGDLPELKAQKKANLKAYHQALDLYLNQQFSEASLNFAELLEENPRDSVLLYYKSKLDTLLLNGVPENWSPIEAIEIK
jgi:predicted ATPase/class 3 adenylate cyclase/GAF domain-containing protein/tRNA A-37 threonylcarbamoyl transferase component Bud32